MEETKDDISDMLVLCRACFCMVHPKPVLRCKREGIVTSFYEEEFDCPKCGERRIYERNKSV